MISTLAELNEFHRQYWAKQKLRLERRTLDPEILSAAIDQLTKPTDWEAYRLDIGSHLNCTRRC